jgi:Spy/CpxP family protein refolding chaperone
MKSNRFSFILLTLLTAVMVLTSINYPAQAETPENRYELQWEKLVKELNLSPEKATEFQAIGAKYSGTRKQLVEKLKKDEADLEKAAAGPTPDGAKIKELVPVIISGHNQLFESFKAQRQEEMALLTPLQQAKYLLALKKWHEERCEPAKAAK